jgi:hypothetical protein
LVRLLAIWQFFPHFGILLQEKTGNSDGQSRRLKKRQNAEQGKRGHWKKVDSQSQQFFFLSEKSIIWSIQVFKNFEQAKKQSTTNGRTKEIEQRLK